MATVRRAVASLLGASLLSIGAVQAAEEESKPATDLQEVVVSVERVTQTLQSYAGTAVTATQGELDSLGITNLVDIPALLPGVEISNYEDNTNIYVRGIGSDANTELGDPAVAPHLDDVYVPRPRGLQVAFFDIDRVEVNVGPQGTVRGRNALGGSVNIVTRKPVFNKFEGYAQAGVGNYDEKEYRGALNVPLIDDVAAARFAVYSSTHDPFIKNVGRLRELTGWESQDDIGGRAHLLIQPLSRWSILLSGDYLRSRGTGSRGIDFFNAARAGINFNDVDDPRQVNMVAFNPTQDTRHYGISLNTTFKTDVLNVQYIGGFRSLHYISDHPSGGRDYAFPGDDDANVARGGIVQPGDPLAQAYLNERVYGNFSALDWDTTSKEHTHELRITSADDARRVTWAAGLFYFKEHQRVFLGIPQDFSTDGQPYLEFNQGSTNGESKSVYGDLTVSLTDKWKVTAGARYSDESKDRIGFNFISSLDTNGVAVRTGTPGFSFAGLARMLRNPDADGDGVPGTLADVVALYKAGVASYGINDTLLTFLNGGCVQASIFGASCANYPGLQGGGGVTAQFGENSDKYLDWRARTQYDLTDKNMVYASVALGHKAPSFNDTVATPTGPVTPPVGPEKSMMFEVGSKNVFDVAGRPLVFNAEAYYFKYTDQVFSSLVGVAFLAKDPVGQAACTDNDQSTACPVVTLNQNVGRSRNFGFQVDSAYNLGRGFALAGTVFYQNTEYQSGSLVIDGRRGGPNGSPLVDLAGNHLPRSPALSLNLRLNQAFAVPGGLADWVISGTYKSSQYLTAFNGGPGKNTARTVTAVDASGVPTAYGPELMQLYDKVNAYFHMDLGIGYTHDATRTRVEVYINNVTDEAHATQAGIDPNTQELVFNPPRTYGVRLQATF